MTHAACYFLSSSRQQKLWRMLVKSKAHCREFWLHENICLLNKKFQDLCKRKAFSRPNLSNWLPWLIFPFVSVLGESVYYYLIFIRQLVSPHCALQRQPKTCVRQDIMTLCLYSEYSYRQHMCPQECLSFDRLWGLLSYELCLKLAIDSFWYDTKTDFCSPGSLLY